jgi:hypothetical protein
MRKPSSAPRDGCRHGRDCGWLKAFTPLADRNALWHGSAHRHMRTHRFNWRRPGVLTSILLAMLMFRAYVPVGFMPASGTPFRLELCPTAASVPMPAHHHHADGHGHFENCPFGSAPAAGPISQGIVFSPPALAVSTPLVDFESQLRSIRLLSAHQPRGPPASPV